MTDITCLVCGKTLEPVTSDEVFYEELNNDHDVPNVQPYDGVMFYADGNYGSTVHDPLEGGKTLIAVICDDCLLAHQDKFYSMPNNTTEEDGPCICCDGDGFVTVETPIAGGGVDDFTEDQMPCPCCRGSH